MINKVIPTDQWELIIELQNSKYLIIETDSIYDKEFDFLTYPNQLKAFRFDKEQIIWKNGKIMSLPEIKLFSKSISKDELKNKNLRISYKNQSPTKEHKTHHWYGVYLYPFKKQINIGESIAGGHAERGGSVTLSIKELLDYNGWKNHFKLSGCEWAIPIIKYNKEDQVINKLVRGICSRSEFNKN